MPAPLHLLIGRRIAAHSEAETPLFTRPTPRPVNGLVPQCFTLFFIVSGVDSLVPSHSDYDSLVECG